MKAHDINQRNVFESNGETIRPDSATRLAPK